jgi:choice-of-anchor A domain-containing protein
LVYAGVGSGIVPNDDQVAITGECQFCHLFVHCNISKDRFSSSVVGYTVGGNILIERDEDTLVLSQTPLGCDVVYGGSLQETGSGQLRVDIPLDGVSESMSECDDEPSDDSTEHAEASQEESESSKKSSKKSSKEESQDKDSEASSDDPSSQCFSDSIDSQYYLVLFDELDAKSAYWAQLEPNGILTPALAHSKQNRLVFSAGDDNCIQVFQADRFDLYGITGIEVEFDLSLEGKTILINVESTLNSVSGKR